MGDLISRAEALERLSLLRKLNSTEPIQIALDAVEQQIQFCETAFNKEKVLEELAIRKENEDEKAAAFDEAGDIYNMEMRDNISLAFQTAIKIVKRGGIDG